MSPSPDTAEPVATPERRWWSWKKILWGLNLGLIFLVVGGGFRQALQSPGVPVTISEETTFITEPLTPRGLPDYAAVLNTRLGEGVTPDTNAVVKLWEALGPLPDQMSRQFHEALAEKLGTSPLPVEGTYFATFHQWLKEQKTPPAEISERTEELADELMASHRLPWKTVEHPELVAWFARNEIPLKLVHEAVHRPYYFRPVMVDPARKDQLGELIFFEIPDVHNYRDIARLLGSRAMWHLGEGRIEQAQQDILDCHRLARHVAHGWSMIEILVAMALESIATNQATVLAVDPQLTAEQARSYRQELEKLGPLLTQAEFVEIIDQGERFLTLDSLIGMAVKQEGASGDSAFIQALQQAFIRFRINWDTVLSEMNDGYDDLVAAHRLPDRAARLKGIQDLGQQLQEENDRLSQWHVAIGVYLGGSKAHGRMLATVFKSLLVPANEQALNSFDAATTRWQIAQVGFALAEYRRIHGRYPERLEELQPEFIEQIPDDIFSGNSLIYQVDPSGLEMKLYSVGRNGVDDGGIRSSEDSPTGEDGDDIGFLDPIPVFSIEEAEVIEEPIEVESP